MSKATPSIKTVGELVAELQKCDQHKPVVLLSACCGCTLDEGMDLTDDEEAVLINGWKRGKP